ncbi:MAG: hypothetical protein VZS44_02515 [Bacilli bacterium]|nr:hypothetical protein [Bacilli bacterium]
MNNIERKNIIVFCICGKAGSGKGVVANKLKESYTKKEYKVIISPYTKYLKKYASEILGEEITENNKPRTFLQKFSKEVIKEKLGYKNFFINRQLEDISIYQYYFDIIIISDVRFPKEIECIKDKGYKTISIGVIRENYDNGLTDTEKKDITETALDNYNKYDFIIKNDGKKDLTKEISGIIRKVDYNE